MCDDTLLIEQKYRKRRFEKSMLTMAVTSWPTLGIAEIGPFLRPFWVKSHIYSFIIFDSWCVDTGRIIIVNGLRHVSLPLLLLL